MNCVMSNKLVEAVNLQFPQILETIENDWGKFHYFVSTECPVNQHLRINENIPSKENK